MCTTKLVLVSSFEKNIALLSYNVFTFWNVLFVFVLEQTLTFIKWDWPCLLARQDWGDTRSPDTRLDTLQNTQKYRNRKKHREMQNYKFGDEGDTLCQTLDWTLCKTHKIQKYIKTEKYWIMKCKSIKWGNTKTSGRQMTQGSTLHKKQKNTEMNKCRNKKV